MVEVNTQLEVNKNIIPFTIQKKERNLAKCVLNLHSKNYERLLKEILKG